MLLVISSWDAATPKDLQNLQTSQPLQTSSRKLHLLSHHQLFPSILILSLMSPRDRCCLQPPPSNPKSLSAIIPRRIRVKVTDMAPSTQITVCMHGLEHIWGKNELILKMYIQKAAQLNYFFRLHRNCQNDAHIFPIEAVAFPAPPRPAAASNRAWMSSCHCCTSGRSMRRSYV